MTGSELLVARLGTSLLHPRRKNRQRIEVAKSIQAFRAFEGEASDAEVWDRLCSELPEWAHSGVVAPVTINKLIPCIDVLDPRNPLVDPRRDSSRSAIRLILDDLYLVLISSDPIWRDLREFRHALRVRRWRRTVPDR